MAINLKSITKGQALLAPRIILLGVEKIGKSTFGASAPNPIFLPMQGERGIDGLGVDQFPPAKSQAEVIEMLGSLYNDKHDYQTVVLDSASALDPIITSASMRIEGVDSPSKLGGGYGRQDDTPMQLWTGILEGLDALRDDRGMTTIVIGHVVVKNFNDPLTEPYDTYEWDIRAKARNFMFRWADCILFANRPAVARKIDTGGPKKVTHAIDGGERRPYTQKRPAHPGGGRNVYGHLPYELPLSWAAFEAAVTAASNTAATPAA